MAYTSKIVILSTLLALTATFSTARPGRVSSVPTVLANDLATRLKLAGDSSKCWDSLIQLQACTGEVILFFINGETYLGPSCCQAIRIIGQQCWPAMFGSIGFTTEEADVLQGFCDSLEAYSPPLPPPSEPPTQAVSTRN